MNSGLKSKKITILIPDGETWLAQPVVNCLAQQREVRIIMVSATKITPMRFSRFIANYFYFNSIDKNKHQDWVDLLTKIVREEKVNVVLPISLSGERLKAFLNSALKDNVAISPLPPINALEVCNNKGLFKLWLEDGNFNHPATVLVNSKNKADVKWDGLTFPVLAKPVLGTGGRGIQRFETLVDLLHFLTSNSNELVIQSYIEGGDLVCNAFCLNGEVLAFTCQKPYGPKDSAFIPAANHEFVSNPAAFNLMVDFVKKMNWSGPINMDLRVDENDGKLHLLEVNPRFWWSVYSSCQAGINFPWLACLVGLSEFNRRNGLNSVEQDLLENTLGKLEMKPIRHVKIPLAGKLFLNRVFLKRYRDLPYHYSALDILMKDPVPKLGVFFSVLLQRIKNNLML